MYDLRKSREIYFFLALEFRKMSKILHVYKKSSNFAPVQWNEGLKQEFPHFYLINYL